MIPDCYICNSRILRHSYHLNCHFCTKVAHLRCLPNISRTDSIYLERSNNQWMCTQCTAYEFPFNQLDNNDEFMHVLSNNWESIKYFPFGEISELCLNPFELNDDPSNSPGFDIDPDLQYFNDTTCLHNVSHCDYYLANTFNKKCDQLCISESCMSLIHINIRSIHKNIDAISDYLETLNVKFTIIGMSETWLHENNAHCYSIDGYNHFYQHRLNKKGGGVSIFVKDNLQVKYRDDLSVNETYMEAIFIEVSNEDIMECDRNVLIGVIYRPPNQDIKLLTEKMSEILHSIKREGKLLYFMGDFNINLLDIDGHIPSSEFLETMYSSSFFPLITKPTRVTAAKSTLIDNIFINDVSTVHCLNGIFFTGITDHFPVFSINYGTKLREMNNSVSTRLYTMKSMEHFTQKLEGTNWQSVCSTDDGPIAFKLFYDKFCSLYNYVFPMKTVKQGYKTKKNWLSNGLKKSIAVKNKLYVRQLKNPSIDTISAYKKYKMCLNRVIRNAERSYYHSILEDNRQNTKKMWMILKDIINKRKSTTRPNHFVIGNETVSNEGTIANKFNDYFTNIGANLAKTIQSTDIDPLSYIKRAIPDSIFINQVETGEVERIIKGLKNSSAGYDGIHSKVLKHSYRSILEPLTHVLNLSILQGFFPSEMKLAKVIPLYKSGDAMKIDNYRPVSVLPLFSKLLEKLMYNRVLAFINRNNLLYEYQFGFRQHHSTNMALITLVDKIAAAIDNSEILVGVFLDLKKAFDTVNHDLLLKKLFKYGIRGESYNWFKDYLTDRKQFVSFNYVESCRLTIKCGVPQGSILGPLLFLLYINDLSNVSEILTPIIFADDTNLFIKGKPDNQIFDTLNHELTKVKHWLDSNRLSLNIDKTHYIIFRSNRNKTDFGKYTIFINNHKIHCVEHVKFIGVTIDACLTWSTHIKLTKSKVAKGIGIIIKARKYVGLSSLKILYNSIIYPHFTYCIEVWGNAADTHLSSLFKLQKKIVRILKSAPYKASTDPIFKELKILKLHDIFLMYTLLFVFKFVKGMLPKIFDGFFIRNNTVIRRKTRQSNLFRVPVCRTVLYEKTIKFNGAKEWNNIEDIIDYNCSIHTFKRKLKIYLLDKL